MKKAIITALVLIVSASATAQNTDTLKTIPSGLYLSENIHKPGFSIGIATFQPNKIVKCLYLTYPNIWHKGYIELINGYIETPRITWAVEYAPMAIGYFINKFYNTKLNPIHPKVLQVIIN